MDPTWSDGSVRRVSARPRIPQVRVRCLWQRTWCKTRGSRFSRLWQQLSDCADERYYGVLPANSIMMAGSFWWLNFSNYGPVYGWARIIARISDRASSAWSLWTVSKLRFGDPNRHRKTVKFLWCTIFTAIYIGNYICISIWSGLTPDERSYNAFSFTGWYVAQRAAASIDAVSAISCQWGTQRKALF